MQKEIPMTDDQKVIDDVISQVGDVITLIDLYHQASTRDVKDSVVHVVSDSIRRINDTLENL